MDETARLFERLLKAHREWDEKTKADKKARLKAIPYKLQLYRNTHNLTREQLGKELGFPRMDIYRWEEGKNVPGEKALRKLKEKGII
ncbi:helix-turn-helix domain-containing protein [Candidatus Omnitrophota bacterium]